MNESDIEKKKFNTRLLDVLFVLAIVFNICAISISKVLLNLYAEKTGLSVFQITSQFEANVLQGFLFNFPILQIIVMSAIYVFISFMYYKKSRSIETQKQFNLLFGVTAFLCIMFFIDFVNDVVVLVATK